MQAIIVLVRSGNSYKCSNSKITWTPPNTELLDQWQKQDIALNAAVFPFLYKL